MASSVEQGRGTIEEEFGRFRTRTIAELRLLNEKLPRAMRLERREIDLVVEDLLSAVRATPARRSVSLLAKLFGRGNGVLRHPRQARNSLKRTKSKACEIRVK